MHPGVYLDSVVTARARPCYLQAMKWATALSRRDAFPAAAQEATQLLREALGTTPDLVLMFASGDPDAAPSLVRNVLDGPRLVG